jgi:hypothetical protein
MWVWNLVSHVEGGTYAEGIYGSIIFDLCPLSQEHNWGIRKGLPINYNHGILNFISLSLLMRVVC